MKIQLTGSQGTGKSTLNKLLIKEPIFKDYIQIDSISEKFAKDMETFKDPIKLRDFQTSIAFYCFSEYINTKNYISSRSFVDTYAYTKYSYKKTGIPIFKTLNDLSLELLKLYSSKEYVFIFVPIMFPLESKNLRSSDIDFQKEIESYIKECLELSEIDYYTIKTLNKRVDEVLNYIKSKGKV